MNSRYRSSECINYEVYNQMHEHNQMSQNRGVPSHFASLDRGMRCGSLDGLSRSFCFDDHCNSGVFATTHNYFNKKQPMCFSCRNKCPLETHSSMHHHAQNKHSESYMDLLEFITTPYYQYQRKNVMKRDFCGNTIITFSYMRQVQQSECVHVNVKNYESSNQNQQNENNETVEVCIPIKVNSPPSSTVSSSSEEPPSSYFTSQLHRNEKHIFINNFNDSPINENMLLLSKQQPGPDYQDPFETFRKNMKRYVQERLSRFEAEITLTNKNNNNTNRIAVNNNNSPVLMETGRNRSLSNQNGARIRLIEDHPSILSFREINNQLNSNNSMNLNASSHVNSKVRNHSSVEQQARIRSSSRPMSSLMVVDPMSVTNLMYMKVVDGHLLK
jgi:hypothetical protein